MGISCRLSAGGRRWPPQSLLPLPPLPRCAAAVSVLLQLASQKTERFSRLLAVNCNDTETVKGRRTKGDCAHRDSETSRSAAMSSRGEPQKSRMVF